MIRIKCPYCGERDHSEFTYGGDGSIIYPSLEASVEEWTKAIFFRENICGTQIETWHHTNGCRLWLKVTRNTAISNFGHATFSKTLCIGHMPTITAVL